MFFQVLNKLLLLLQSLLKSKFIACHITACSLNLL